MKQIFFRKELILLVCTIIFMSCSKEEETIAVESKNFEEAQFFERNSGEVYDDFEELFSTLYGTNFDLESTVLYEQTEGDYYLTKVNLNNNLEGYFVDLPDRNVVYFEHDMNTGNLDYYDYDDLNNNMVLTSHDLTLDTTYDYTPLNPDNTAPEGERRFWGKGSTSCQDVFQSYSNGISWCQKYCYTAYYVLFMDINGGQSYPSGGLFPCN